MAEAIGKFRTVLIAMTIFIVSTTTSFADISSRCQVSEDPDHVSSFQAEYREFTGGREIGNDRVEVLDCGYLLIIETPLPQGAFGSNAAYVFLKEEFRLIMTILFD
jgi:hypothetical protein